VSRGFLLRRSSSQRRALPARAVAAPSALLLPSRALVNRAGARSS
jgi:hypothetical protein